MKRKLVVCLVVPLTVASPLFAIFGIGDVVFDPSNYAEALAQAAQLTKQYEQLVQTYQTVRSQYDQMVQMARQVPVNMTQRYRAATTPWKTSVATNTYGSTAGWINSINTGTGVSAGYKQATQSLAAYDSLSAIPPEQRARITTEYATVELADGSNQSSMESIGRLRANAPGVATAIQGLETDSLSSNPDMNTEIAVLNKINAANIIGLHNSQDTNQLLIALTESQVVAAKRMRDAEARAINHHIRFVREGKAVLDAQSKGSADAMMAWRMP